MTKLSVNINKVATLRNARGGNNPDVIKVALDCEAFGAELFILVPMNAISVVAMCMHCVLCLPLSLILRAIPVPSLLIWC